MTNWGRDGRAEAISFESIGTHLNHSVARFADKARLNYVEPNTQEPARVHLSRSFRSETFAPLRLRVDPASAKSLRVSASLC